MKQAYGYAATQRYTTLNDLEYGFLSDDMAVDFDDELSLTETERQVYRQIMNGQSYAGIAEKTNLDHKAAKKHAASILAKMCLDDGIQAAILQLGEAG